MRAVLIIALLVCLAAMASWVNFFDHGDTATLNFDKQEARDDSREAIDDVEEAVDEIGDDIEQQLDPDAPEVDIEVGDEDVDIDVRRDDDVRLRDRSND